MKRLGKPMLATSAISSLPVIWKITGSKTRPRSCAKVSSSRITVWYSPSMAGLPPRGPRVAPRRLSIKEGQEVLHRRPDGLQIHEIGKRRPLLRLGGLLHVLAEPPHPPPAGVDVAVDHQIERFPGFLEAFLGQVEVTGARLAVGEHEQELVVLSSSLQQLDRLFEPGADMRAAARLDAEELIARLLFGHVLEHDVAAQVRWVPPLQVMPENEDRLADQ